MSLLPKKIRLMWTQLYPNDCFYQDYEISVIAPHQVRKKPYPLLGRYGQQYYKKAKILKPKRVSTSGHQYYCFKHGGSRKFIPVAKVISSHFQNKESIEITFTRQEATRLYGLLRQTKKDVRQQWNPTLDRVYDLLFQKIV